MSRTTKDGTTSSRDQTASMSRFDPSDAEWAIIAPLLPGGDG
jgi:hypothetical protein